MKQLNNSKDIEGLLDYYLINELVEGLPRSFPKRIQYKLTLHNVSVSKNTVYVRAHKILKGAVIHPAADVSGSPAARVGKDQAYAGFWTLIDIVLPNPAERHYIGLPANQLDVVCHNIGSTKITVCEHDFSRYEKLMDLSRLLNMTRPGPQIDLLFDDIFSVIDSVENRFNIFDLDLMCNLPKGLRLEYWATSIYRASSLGTVVLNLVTTIGRSITEREYRDRKELFNQLLKEAGFTKLVCSSFAYRDRRVPMRVEKYVLRKENKNGES
jgi:putative hemolysin